MNENWNTGLYGCLSDMPVCFDTWLMCCCELSRQYMALQGVSDTYHVPLLFASPVAFPCLFLYTRRALLKKYHIYEPLCLSLVTVLCCGSCSVCQVHRELAARRVDAGTTLSCLFSSAVTSYRML